MRVFCAKDLKEFLVFSSTLKTTATEFLEIISLFHGITNQLLVFMGVIFSFVDYPCP